MSIFRMWPELKLTFRYSSEVFNVLYSFLKYLIIFFIYYFLLLWYRNGLDKCIIHILSIFFQYSKYIFLESAQVKCTATLEPILIIIEFILRLWFLMTFNDLYCNYLQGYSISACKMSKIHGHKEYKIL